MNNKFYLRVWLFSPSLGFIFDCLYDIHFHHSIDWVFNILIPVGINTVLIGFGKLLEGK